jgi:hypothetical protein
MDRKLTEKLSSGGTAYGLDQDSYDVAERRNAPRLPP